MNLVKHINIAVKGNNNSEAFKVKTQKTNTSLQEDLYKHTLNNTLAMPSFSSTFYIFPRNQEMADEDRKEEGEKKVYVS